MVCLAPTDRDLNQVTRCKDASTSKPATDIARTHEVLALIRYKGRQVPRRSDPWQGTFYVEQNRRPRDN